MSTFPEQDLRSLHGHGIYCPSQWGMPYTPLRYFYGHGHSAAAYIATYDHLLTCAGNQPSRRLSNFAGVCQMILTELSGLDDLATAMRRGLIGCLLDMPALEGLHTRLTYITELCDYLRRHLRAWETSSRLLGGGQKHAFVDELQAELLRRRETWKEDIRARCPIDLEELTAAIWHPRRVSRLLETAAGDADAEERILEGWTNAWTIESVGRGDSPVLQGAALDAEAH